MADWNADLYRRFERERTRPARDLLAQAAQDEARMIVDLGCGPGNSTELLAERFPHAEVIGVDTSPAMLASARARMPGVVFVEADLSTFAMSRPADVIFANAVLQWVPDHATLLPRLLAMLAPGGVLAVQMPDNSEEPSHRLMRQIAAEPRFRSSFDGRAGVPPRPVLAADAYYDLLAPLADTDVWHTTYRHPIDSAAGIVAWVRATGLRPFLDALPPSQTDAFLARYEAEIDTAYPPRADGLRLLAFPRLFIVARRRA